MKVIAINGSPRKNKNTATLLNKALQGAESVGADTERIDLYDLDYKGCTSCFACKQKNGKSYGTCAKKDDLTIVLEKIKQADALILGSPIYLCNVTGEMKSFFERLIFPYLSYANGHKTLFEGNIKTGFVYTMNVTKDQMNQKGFQQNLVWIEEYLRNTFGHCESLFAYDTYQFENYDHYIATDYDKQHKAQVQRDQFPKDEKAAFEMGLRLTK